MNTTFKKLGLSASIAMLTLGLSSCDVSSTGDQPASDNNTTHQPDNGNNGGGDNGGGSDNGNNGGGDNGGGSDNGNNDGGDNGGGSDNGNNGGGDNGGGSDNGNNDGGDNGGGSDGDNTDGDNSTAPEDEEAVDVVDEDSYDGTIELDQLPKGDTSAALQTSANPFSDAYFYVNPDTKSMMDTSLSIVEDEGNSQLANKIKYVQRQPSAVWMDSIATVNGDGSRRSLVEHLDAALAQQNYLAQQDGSISPMTVVFVIYNLPDRDCAAYSSNGQLIEVGKPGDNTKTPNNGLQTYEQDYITPIKDAFSDPKYASLRIVAMLEPDSFPNMITNTSYSPLNPNRGASTENGGYCNNILKIGNQPSKYAVEGEDGNTTPYLGLYGAGLRFAIKELSDIPNVYTYMDIAHAGWLGWDSESDLASNMKRGVKYFKQLIDGADGKIDGKGLEMVRGFGSNTSGYTPTEEPAISSSYNDREALAHSGVPSFYEWNPAVDELSYLRMLQKYFTTSGENIGNSKFDTDKLGFIIDTARNGWGFEGRPTPGSVPKGTDQSKRVDQRGHRGHWCNVNNAGIGEAPKANPDPSRPYLDAFFWMKPPGESDGISFDVTKVTPDTYNTLDAIDRAIVDRASAPEFAGKSLDTMCMPGKIRESTPTDVTPGYAPHAGAWFHKQFIMLINNAYPALGESDYD
jgi:cellulose 1,4-beta-cellobiosidase